MNFPFLSFSFFKHRTNQPLRTNSVRSRKRKGKKEKSKAVSLEIDLVLDLVPGRRTRVRYGSQPRVTRTRKPIVSSSAVILSLSIIEQPLDSTPLDSRFDNNRNNFDHGFHVLFHRTLPLIFLLISRRRLITAPSPICPAGENVFLLHWNRYSQLLKQRILIRITYASPSLLWEYSFYAS